MNTAILKTISKNGFPQGIVFAIAFWAVGILNAEEAVKPSMELELAPTVSINKNIIQLRDLLVPSAATVLQGESQVSDFLDTSVGTPPSLGKEATLRRFDLDLVLRRLSPRISWTWKGAEQCVVSRPATEISSTQATGLIEDALKRYVEKAGQVNVLQLLNYTAPLIPKDYSSMNVELISPNTKTQYGSALISVDVQGKPFLRHQVRFEWEWKHPVWVAQQSHPAGRIVPEFFNLEVRDILTASGEAFIESTLPSNLILERGVSKGDTLVKANLKVPLAVLRGSAVNACVNSGNLNVSMKAIALENGNIGQTIRVKNPSSGKEIFGRVTYENVVEVIP